MPNRRTARPTPWSRLALCGALLCAGLASGCTRKFYRSFADADAEQLIAEKDVVPVWKLEQYHVYPDPRARFADDTNPDRPPMPPDDPAVADLTPHPQKPGKAGIGLVEGFGYLEYLAACDAANRAEEEARKAKEAEERRKKEEDAKKADGVQQASAAMTGGAGPMLGLTAYDQLKAGEPSAVKPQTAGAADACLPKPYRIKLDQAVELALFNSREFQSRREDLFLAALPVSLERFAFSTQFFLTEQVIREVTGSQRPEGAGNRFRFNTAAGFSKTFITGATLLFRFANRTVINLTGAGPHTVSVSDLSFDVVQPFLRGGGFAVTLEPLTQVERNLVYAIREFARFRKQFFVAVAAGADTINPRFFGGFDVNGLASTGPIGANFAGGLVAPNEGFLPTLLRYAILRNEQENVRALERILRRFETFLEGGDISQLQLGQVEQQLLGGRSTVLQRDLEYRDGLDRFKIQLGLPTNTPLELDDTSIRPINDQIVKFQPIFDELEDARRQAFGLRRAGDPPPAEDSPKPDDPATLRRRLADIFLKHPVTAGTRFRRTIAQRWGEFERLSREQLDARLKELADRRQKLLDRKAEEDTRGERFSDGDSKALARIEFDLGLGLFEARLRDYEARPWERMVPERAALERPGAYARAVNNFVIVLSEARNERLDTIRESWPDLPRVCVGGVDLMEGDLDQALAAAAQVALANRFDLMNARAQLVDAWRQIAVRANALLGVLDVQYSLNTSTPPGQNLPFSFGGGRDRHQLIINAELPLVRRLERNLYRASLIAYQRQRRALQAAEDFVVNDVRTEIRQLRVLAENYEIQQRQIELAYFQVDNSTDVLYAPPQPTGGAGPSTASAGNAAALTNQLLSAQRSLPNAQNSLYTIWVNFQVTRLLLYRDLELMPLDNQGVWIDEISRAECPCRDGADQPERGRDGADVPGGPARAPAGTPELAPEPGRYPGDPSGLPQLPPREGGRPGR